jgi:hypothetical protein
VTSLGSNRFAKGRWTYGRFSQDALCNVMPAAVKE